MESISEMLAVGKQGGMVRYKPHPFSIYKMKVLFKQQICSGLDLTGGLRSKKEKREKEKQSQAHH
jgi:hypothetical protein